MSCSPCIRPIVNRRTSLPAQRAIGTSGSAPPISSRPFSTDRGRAAAGTRSPRRHFGISPAPDGDPLGQLDRGELDFLILPEYLLEKQHPKNQFVRVAPYLRGWWTGNHLVKERPHFRAYMSLGTSWCGSGQRRSPASRSGSSRQFGHTRRVEIITDSFNSSRSSFLARCGWQPCINTWRSSMRNICSCA